VKTVNTCASDQSACNLNAACKTYATCIYGCP
jgi:hypothetical protein